MTYFSNLFFSFFLIFVLTTTVNARTIKPEDKVNKSDVASKLAPHKALYDINLVATRNGAQVLNISGKMYFELKSNCEAWVTDHRFNLFYEYADSPAMNITSDFSTFEDHDGENFNFSARRKRDRNLYEELRGQASVDDEGIGFADFRMPDTLEFKLNEGTLFPMGHTMEIVKQALSNQNFFSAVVFDGSDDKGPVEINTFIGQAVNPMTHIEPSKELEMGLLNNRAWKIRMAVFPTLENEESAPDYEMDVIFHENGIISDMLIDYDNFSVTQKLVALEPIKATKCQK